MVAPGDAIPSEPGRQVTAEDNAERNNREAEKNATKASLNLQATAGGTPGIPSCKCSGQGCYCFPAAQAVIYVRPVCLYGTESDCLCFAAGKQDLEAPAPPAATGPKTYAAPAFDAPDSENPKKAAPILETEAEFVRYRRQRTVRQSVCATETSPPIHASP